jgi:hypothetical protein
MRPECTPLGGRGQPLTARKPTHPKPLDIRRRLGRRLQPALELGQSKTRREGLPTPPESRLKLPNACFHSRQRACEQRRDSGEGEAE